MTLQNAQNQVDHWIKTYGVRYFHELTNLGILVEEVGELSRHLVRTYGEQSYKSNMSKEESHQCIREEMADVLWVLLCLANQTGIDLTQAFEESMEKKTTRDSTRHTDNTKLSSPGFPDPIN